jgi:hypothetical protein
VMKKGSNQAKTQKPEGGRPRHQPPPAPSPPLHLSSISILLLLPFFEIQTLVLSGTLDSHESSSARQLPPSVPRRQPLYLLLKATTANPSCSILFGETLAHGLPLVLDHTSSPNTSASIAALLSTIVSSPPPTSRKKTLDENEKTYYQEREREEGNRICGFSQQLPLSSPQSVPSHPLPSALFCATKLVC